MPLLPRRRENLPVDQEWLNACAKPDQNRCEGYLRYQRYYDGEHGGLLLDRTRRYLQRSGLSFCENFCEPVVDVMAERLVVTGFTLEDKGGQQTAGESDDQQELAQWVDGVLQRNRLDAKQRTTHSTALVKGDAWLVVDFDNTRRLPRFTFNAPDKIKACYSPDEPDSLEWVAKRWNSRATSQALNPDAKPIVRLNMYYPDRLEKYFKVASDGTDDGQWERWQDEGDGSWPVKWVDKAGAPLGIPLFHFRHKPLGNKHGRSEIHGTIPQQDELNKQIIDLNDILDYQAWPTRWVSGVTGDTDTLKANPGDYLKFSNENAKAGQFDAADLNQVVATIDATIARIAHRSRTPHHLLVGGRFPSGDALTADESGLIAKVEASQVDFGQAWEDAMMLAVRLADQQGVLPVSLSIPDLVVQAQWKTAATRDELVEAQRLLILQQLGVSQRTILTEAGYDPDQEEENRGMEQAALNEAAGQLLDAGAAAGSSYAGTAVSA